MKKSVILSGLLALSMFGLMGMGGNKEEAPRQAVGIVQTVQVYEQSKLAKVATERLEKLQDEAMAKLDAMQKEMSAAEEAKDDVKKQRLQVEMQQQLYSMQGALEAEQQKVLKVLQEAMQKVIGQCRAEKGMTVVFEAGSALSYDQAVDITSEVVTRLDQEKVDFGPLPSLEPAPAPEQNAAADNAADAAKAPARGAEEKPESADAAPAPAEKPAEAPAAAPEVAPAN